MSDKALRIAFVVISLSFLWSIFRIDTLREKNKKDQKKVQELTHVVDSLQNLNDSLDMELFPTTIELNRFQVAYEIFLRRNPKAAEQYGTIISEETE